jgi:hypothetical protein
VFSIFDDNQVRMPGLQQNQNPQNPNQNGGTSPFGGDKPTRTVALRTAWYTPGLLRNDDPRGVRF